MTEKEAIKVLKTRRKEKGLTLIEVSKSLGIHRNSLGRMESGKIQNIKYEFIERYAKLLGYELVLIHFTRI